MSLCRKIIEWLRFASGIGYRRLAADATINSPEFKALRAAESRVKMESIDIVEQVKRLQVRLESHR